MLSYELFKALKENKLKTYLKIQEVFNLMYEQLSDKKNIPYNNKGFQKLKIIFSKVNADIHIEEKKIKIFYNGTNILNVDIYIENNCFHTKKSVRMLGTKYQELLKKIAFEREMCEESSLVDAYDHYRNIKKQHDAIHKSIYCTSAVTQN